MKKNIKTVFGNLEVDTSDEAIAEFAPDFVHGEIAGVKGCCGNVIVEGVGISSCGGGKKYLFCTLQDCKMSMRGLDLVKLNVEEEA